MLIAAAALVWVVGHPSPAGQTVGSVGASSALALTAEPAAGSAPSITSPAANAPVADPPTNAPATTPAPTPPASTTPTATNAPVAAAPPSPPSRVRIPTLAVDASVTPVGVTDGGDVQVPDDVATVGWYRFGPAPGATGSAVLIGHVDNYRQGVGALARIGDLSPGDGVEITDEDGDVRTFTVVAREQWAKAEAPLDRLFDRGGSSRLVLITCGGAFDDSRLEYTDTIAVTAIPTTA